MGWFFKVWSITIFKIDKHFICYNLIKIDLKWFLGIEYDKTIQEIFFPPVMSLHVFSFYICYLFLSLMKTEGSNIVISISYTGNCRYGGDLARQLVRSLLSVLVSCGSVRISFSRRTPQKV